MSATRSRSCRPRAAGLDARGLAITVSGISRGEPRLFSRYPDRGRRVGRTGLSEGGLAMIRSPLPDVEIPHVSLSEFVLGRAVERGDRPALVDAPSGRTITYAQLAELVRAVAAGLVDRGFGKGEVFAHYAPNLPEFAVAFH